MDADWNQTRQAAPFLPHCSDIVAIGRVKWIEGSEHTGKDNYAWYRFDTRHKGGAVFHGRDHGEVILSGRTRVCQQCRKRYEPRRSSSLFCSPACKQHAYRKRLSVTSSVTPASTPGTAIEPSDSAGEEFRYVNPRLAAEGWQPTPALDGTHHGEYSVLMRRGGGGRAS